jgi:FAS-associated factor 2
MSVLSRQAGARACTPQALTRHIEERLLPRVKPILERYRSEEVTRVRDRVDREESERRALEAQMRDSERIMRAREERERAQRDEDERIRAAENKRRAEENAKRLVSARRAFWARSGQGLGPEPDKSEGEIVRLTLRLPNGGRVVRQFRPSDGVSVLYSFVSSNLVSGADNESHSDDPYDANSDGWGFALATAFPRVPIPWVPYSADGKGGSTVVTVSNGALKGGAVVVVEMSAAAAPLASQGDGTLEDDEYLSE